MAEMQTSADIQAQLTRKSIDFLSGVAAGVGIARGVLTADIVNGLVQNATIIVPAVLALVGNAAWWKKAQEKVVTVAGLEASTVSGSTLAAAQVAKVIKTAEAEKTAGS